MEVIILAGGRGTRLAAVLKDRPKPMAEIAGRPFLEYLLDYLLENGVKTVILSVSHMAEAIQQHFGEAYKGLEVRYAVEETPLGTGGAIKNALRFATEDHVFAVNGDSLAELNYQAMLRQHIAKRSKLTIAVRMVADVSRYGAISVDRDGFIQSFAEKRSSGKGLINSGVYLMQRDIFASFDLPNNFSMETDFVSAQLQRLHPLSVETTGYFIDIGIPSDLVRAEDELPARRSQ